VYIIIIIIIIIIITVIHSPKPKSSVGIAGYELEVRGSICSNRDFSLLHSVQTDSGNHPAFSTMGTGSKVAGE
jgi:hypothetical protein